jgi:ubiquinone/menaquinone biosynthesis C-methylase UbiE
MLKATCLPIQAAVVADVGAGTGLLTRDLLRHGCRVIAVEPNPEMRAAADRLLGGTPGYQSLNACAEAIPLENASVDLVTAAQAFHWFDVDRARAEFLRILKPKGQVVLIWNDRVTDDSLQVMLNELFEQHGGTQRATMIAHDHRADVPRFFGTAAPIVFSWPNEQHLDEAGLLGLVFSRSYMPLRTTPQGLEVAERVRGIFQLLASHGTVRVRYRTVAIVGRPESPL